MITGNGINTVTVNGKVKQFILSPTRLFNGMQNIWPDNNVPELISAGYVKLSPHTIYLFSRVCHRRNT